MKDKFIIPSKKETAEFYDKLVSGEESRGLFGMSKRFNTKLIAEKQSTKKYFVNKVVPYLSAESKVLDFGCGPGTFLLPIAKYCKEIIGVDISKNFIEECNRNINDNNLLNAKSFHISPNILPFKDEYFDVIILVDVIHHLENIKETLDYLFRYLKPGGRVLIFEPNKLNPLMFLMHLLDKNERGLLRVGSPYKYRNILKNYCKQIVVEYSGLVVGPQSMVYDLITNLLNLPIIKNVLGWLNPKIFIIGRK